MPFATTPRPSTSCPGRDTEPAPRARPHDRTGHCTATNRQPCLPPDAARRGTREPSSSVTRIASSLRHWPTTAVSSARSVASTRRRSRCCKRRSTNCLQTTSTEHLSWARSAKSSRSAAAWSADAPWPTKPSPSPSARVTKRSRSGCSTTSRTRSECRSCSTCHSCGRRTHWRWPSGSAIPSSTSGRSRRAGSPPPPRATSTKSIGASKSGTFLASLLHEPTLDLDPEVRDGRSLSPGRRLGRGGKPGDGGLPHRL